MKKPKIAFFVGSDITSHLILNRTIHILALEGFEMKVYFVEQKPNPAALPALKELYFYERTVLNDIIYTYLDNIEQKEKAELMSPKKLSEKYQELLEIKSIKDVNHPEIIKELKDEEVNAGVSIRCYQKFSDPIINYFKNVDNSGLQSFFVNLHPGILPFYRGVTTYSRSMQNKEKIAGFTLHHIDKRWDAGPIIKIASGPLDYKLSVIENMCAHKDMAADLLIEIIQLFAQGETLPSVPQDEKLKHYYTHASALDLEDFKTKNIRLARKDEIISLILSKYAMLNPAQTRALKNLIK